MIILSHQDAFRYWMHYTGPLPALQEVTRKELTALEPEKPQIPFDELAKIGIFPSEEKPISLLFRSEASRLIHPTITPHIIKSLLPRRAVLRLSQEIAIVSPEFCFALLAQEYNLRRMTLIGTELCGAYAFANTGELAMREPLTTPAKISVFLTQIRLRRTELPQKAPQYVVPNAESPMEAKLALLLSLPTTWGGYGLPQPELNHRVSLSEASRKLYPHEYCRLDLYWPGKRLDVEYDGLAAHTGAMHAKDVARLMALRRENIEVIVLSAEQIFDNTAFDYSARLIGSKLGKSCRIRVKDFQAKQRALRKILSVERTC